ncbi:BA2291 family sporulation histidine kinase [Bacillus cereus]|uniref:BA2291 family sporulation histidine kinase n=1 Tax=Bacillus cereus TaxID=1396 RepID=UPI0039E6F79B
MEMEGMEVFPIDKDIKEIFCSHLKNNRHQFVENWKNKMIISEKDPFKLEVVQNGEDLLELIIELTMEDKDINYLQPLCEKIAIERAGADANIGDFVYNANVGRNELFEAMCELDVSARELKPIMAKIHTCFDKLIYYTVLKYSEIISKNLEEKQQYINETHKERLTILGQMSASFVHEFRISQFLLVSKKEMWNESERFWLNDLFQDIIQFLYPSLVNANVLIEKNLPYPIPLVGYRSEVRQVFLNILMNSIDALESMKEERKIIIDVFEEDQAIRIVIKNNGPMIPAENVETIFEPFVTTKKLGTGIGLFVCKQIVEKHNGSIMCRSDNDWTEFQIAFQK